MRKGLSFLIVLFSSLYLAHAQNADFSGTWILNKRTSNRGNDYINGVPSKMRVIQHEDSIIIHKQTLNQNGLDTVYIDTLIVGGMSELLMLPDKVKKNVVQWKDDGFRLIQNLTYQNIVSGKVEHKIVYNWNLSGTNILILNRFDENLISGEIWSMEGVYKKRTF
ncbi:hypothetical protein A3860_17065 [Niastella vici]|uniref:Lipocalin-like domain-containing protein n=1 Tax=Niastella vici TaxID=1703345 RepID=A0A1V9G462_9BACT|nr:hypothetical protein [Niastella vici]OQP65377.1 hypothetical protein A3860_17065 [Niastella vici]